MKISTTAQSDRSLIAIAESSATSYLYLRKFLEIVKQTDINDYDPFALVNNEYYIYLIPIVRSGYEIFLIIAAHDKDTVHVLDYVPFVRRRSIEQRRRLAHDGALLLGITPDDIRLAKGFS